MNRMTARVSKLESSEGSLRTFILQIFDATPCSASEALALRGITAGESDLVIGLRKPGEGTPTILSVDGAPWTDEMEWQAAERLRRAGPISDAARSWLAGLA